MTVPGRRAFLVGTGTALVTALAACGRRGDDGRTATPPTSQAPPTGRATGPASLTTPVTWHAEPAHVIDTGDVRLVVLERGGKVASLVDAESRTEWLAQPEGSALADSGYGADFIASEMCGWDECAPSVSATTLGDARIPDHGEVWGVDWTTNAKPDALVQEVSGQALPYTLRRTLTTSNRAVRFAYAVTNDGDDDLPFTWTGHPQFVANSETVVQLTGEVVEAIVPGDRAGEPLLDRAGTARALEGVRRGGSHKSWLRLRPGAAAVVLAHGDQPGRLRFSWDARTLPYVAIWQDNAQYSREPVIAPELSNGWYDDLAVAKRRDRCLVVPAGKTATWSFELGLAKPG